MDQYLVYFVPFIVVGFGIMLAPFISYGWPDGLTRFVEFCVEMANGVWVAGVALVVLMSIGLPLPAAAVVSWPVMFFAGRYFAQLSYKWQARSYEIKRRAWEERKRREEERSDRGWGRTTCNMRSRLREHLRGFRAAFAVALENV